MNPNQPFDEINTVLGRAYITLFRMHDDEFIYPIDRKQDEYNELTARLISNSRDFNTDVISIVSVNNSEAYSKVKNTVQSMGLKVLSEEKEIEEDGHELKNCIVSTSGDFDYSDEEWNVPHLIVYGSLRPEIEESFYDVFDKNQHSIVNIRNHYTIYGEEVTESDKTKFSDSLSRSFLQGEELRRLQSNINRSTVV